MRQSKSKGPKWSRRAGVNGCQYDMRKEVEHNEMKMLKKVPTTTPPCLRFFMFSCKQGKVLKKWGGLLRWCSTKDPEKQNNGANEMNIEQK